MSNFNIILISFIFLGGWIWIVILFQAGRRKVNSVIEEYRFPDQIKMKKEIDNLLSIGEVSLAKTKLKSIPRKEFTKFLIGYRYKELIKLHDYNSAIADIDYLLSYNRNDISLNLDKAACFYKLNLIVKCRDLYLDVFNIKLPYAKDLAYLKYFELFNADIRIDANNEYASLFHVTHTDNVNSILKNGLMPKSQCIKNDTPVKSIFNITNNIAQYGEPVQTDDFVNLNNILPNTFTADLAKSIYEKLAVFEILPVLLTSGEFTVGISHYDSVTYYLTDTGANQNAKDYLLSNIKGAERISLHFNGLIPMEYVLNIYLSNPHVINQTIMHDCPWITICNLELLANRFPAFRSYLQVEKPKPKDDLPF